MGLFKSIKKLWKKGVKLVKKVVKSKAFKVLAAVALIAVGAAYFSAAAYGAMPGFVQATAAAIPGFNTIGAGATMAANAANAAAIAQTTGGTLGTGSIATGGGTLTGTGMGGVTGTTGAVTSTTATEGALKTGGLLAHMNANPVTTMALTSGVGAGLQSIAAAKQADKDRKAFEEAERKRRIGSHITPTEPIDYSTMQSTTDYGLGIGGDREERHNKEVERLRGLINGRSKRTSATG